MTENSMLAEKAYSAIFLAFLMYGRATDILARRWCCEECAGNTCYKLLWVSKLNYSQNGESEWGVETSLWQDTQSLFLKSTHRGCTHTYILHLTSHILHLTHYCIPTFCPFPLLINLLFKENVGGAVDYCTLPIVWGGDGGWKAQMWE